MNDGDGPAKAKRGMGRAFIQSLARMASETPASRDLEDRRMDPANNLRIRQERAEDLVHVNTINRPVSKYKLEDIVAVAVIHNNRNGPDSHMRYAIKWVGYRADKFSEGGEDSGLSWEPGYKFHKNDQSGTLREYKESHWEPFKDWVNEHLGEHPKVWLGDLQGWKKPTTGAFVATHAKP